MTIEHFVETLSFIGRPRSRTMNARARERSGAGWRVPERDSGKRWATLVCRRIAKDLRKYCQMCKLSLFPDDRRGVFLLFFRRRKEHRVPAARHGPAPTRVPKWRKHGLRACARDPWGWHSTNHSTGACTRIFKHSTPWLHSLH